MKSEHPNRIEQLFQSALDLAPEQRSAFLDKGCAGDEELRRDVESLLAAHHQAGDFIEDSASDVAAGLLAEGSSPSSLVGRAIGQYEILACIGAGGMGDVYLATDKMGRKVALKLLKPRLSNDQQGVARFLREAQAVLSLNHPNIVTVYDIGLDDETHYIASELIEGQSLRERLIRKEEMGISEALDIAIQVSSALVAAHEKGIIHRDIKPENIMLRPDGYVKVVDFGIAKLVEGPAGGPVATDVPTKPMVKTAEGLAIGTVHYMSPEQARGLPVDARTDTWSLGVVIYEMISGRRPFDGETVADVLNSLLERQPAPLFRFCHDVPETLEWIVNKALRKEKNERYQTAAELLTDLKELRRRLEFVAEQERSGQLMPQKAPEAVSIGESINPETVAAIVGPTADSRPHATSSVEYMVNEIKRHKPAGLITLTAILIATAIVAYIYFTRINRTTITSIAVLPLVNASNDPNTEYLSDGISGSLINSLSQLPQLKVIAQSSTFKYKGKEIDPQEVANALGVQAIVTGRIVRLGDTLQISVELVNARKKTQIWGDQYNRKTADLQTVQAEIARTISEQLRIRLTSAQEQQVTKRATENPEAYRLFLNGEFYSGKGRTEDEKKAFDYYNQAITLDPNFALAYVRLAEKYDYFGNTGTLDPRETQAKAMAAAKKALELDDTLAQAHATLGAIKINEWDWSGAEGEYKRALELNPNLASAHRAYSVYLMIMGRHTEALAEIKYSLQLDPLVISVRYREGATLFNARRYDEAIRQLQQVIELQPDFSYAHYFLGTSYAMKGMYTEAIAAYQRFSSIEGETTSTQIYLGYVYAMSGQREKAVAILNKLKTTKEYVSPAELAILYTGLGDKEGAFQELERAYGTHDLQMQYLKVEPHYDSLRSDPRFTDLMRRVGLPP